MTACARRLRRSNTQIGNDGSRALAGALPGLTTLQDLQLL
jgi:hypothetical protein